MEQFIISLRVTNQFGVLTRVSSLFSRRGFNIDSLTVSATETEGVSRMTIVMTGDEYTRKQILKQLAKLHEVLQVQQLVRRDCVARELMLIKVEVTDENRQKIKDTVDIFKAKVVDMTNDTMLIVVSGTMDKVDNFVRLMKDVGIKEMCNTGPVAMMRGDGCLRDVD